MTTSWRLHGARPSAGGRWPVAAVVKLGGRTVSSESVIDRKRRAHETAG